MSGDRVKAGAQFGFAAATAVLAAALFVACGASSHYAATPPSSTAPTASATTPALRDLTPTAADFVNINTMARVGDHFIRSLNGHLAEAEAVARSAKGGVYPVGTVLQLLPTEAMVKRHKGYSSSTDDWEFFRLNLSPTGTVIAQSGTRVKNFLGSDCASCHAAAASKFDFVCGTNHGCAPLPLTAAQIAMIQARDPRPK
jgi:hypothetical protein